VSFQHVVLLGFTFLCCAMKEKGKWESKTDSMGILKYT